MKEHSTHTKKTSKAAANQAVQKKSTGRSMSSAQPVQYAGIEEEEPMQGKFETIQKVEEEEPLQGKFETVQKVEEEEPLQGKFDTVQRMAGEEEELPAQGKFETIQKMEEEEPLQGKFEAVQRKEEAPAANTTGMPNNLKAGIENLSGMDMSDVRVN